MPPSKVRSSFLQGNVGKTVDAPKPCGLAVAKVHLLPSFDAAEDKDRRDVVGRVFTDLVRTATWEDSKKEACSAQVDAHVGKGSVHLHCLECDSVITVEDEQLDKQHLASRRNVFTLWAAHCWTPGHSRCMRMNATLKSAAETCPCVRCDASGQRPSRKEECLPTAHELEEDDHIALVKLDQESWVKDGKSSQCKHCKKTITQRAATSNSEHRRHRLLHLRLAPKRMAMRESKRANTNAHRNFFCPMDAEEMQQHRELRCHGFTEKLTAAEQRVRACSVAHAPCAAIQFQGGAPPAFLPSWGGTPQASGGGGAKAKCCLSPPETKQILTVLPP